MKLFGWKRDSFRFFGIKILRRKKVRLGVVYMFVGIVPIFFIYSPLEGISKDFSLKMPLNTQKMDERVKEVADKLPILTNTEITGRGLIILATEIYDMGGHTECIKNIVSAIPEHIRVKVLLTRIDSSFMYAPKKIKEIASYTIIDGVQYSGSEWKIKIYELFNKIMQDKPKTILSFIHMDDSFGAALLSMLKRAGINILYFNHGSHYPALGMSFADVILEGTETTEKITREQRGFKNTRIVGLPYLKEADLPNFSIEEVEDIRKKLTVNINNILTMSGATSYKFFNEEKTESLYFDMIKRLLNKNHNMIHVVITNPFNYAEKIKFDEIFSSSDLTSRVKILKNTPDYKILFKAADIFIDSFPISSALTQIDLLSLKVPNVVKINKENPIWTFHEYMPERYPYAFETIEGMECGIQDLIDNPSKRIAIKESNYKFFLDNYEGKKWIQHLLDLTND